MRFRLSTSRAVLFGVMFVTALIVFLPLRVVVGGVTARAADGLAWAGHLEEARVGPAVLGDVDTRISPLRLLMGEARLAVSRPGLSGAITVASNRREVEGLTGTLPMEAVPIASFDLSDVTVRFRDGICDRAEGIVRADSDRGALNGSVRCDRGALLLPLASASGQDRLDLRITGDGRYSAGLIADGRPVSISGRLDGL